MRTARRFLKRGLEFLLASRPALAAQQSWARGRTVILAYHNVLPDEETVTGLTPLHLGQSEFKEHLDLLVEFTEIVPLEHILDPPTVGNTGRFRVAITFDDAYRGTLRVAIPELSSRGLAATVFVPPGLLGASSFWWDAFASHHEGHHEECLGRLQGKDDRVRDWASRRATEARKQGPSQCPSTEAELLEAASGASGLVTFGPHTYRHPNLTALPRAEIENEVASSMEWLKDRGLPMVDWLAIPYGLSGPVVEEACERCGVRAALLVQGGWVPMDGVNQFRVPRVPIPRGVTPENFLLRLFGLIRT